MTTTDVLDDEMKTLCALHTKHVSCPNKSERPFEYYYGRAVYFVARSEPWADCAFVPLDQILHFSLAISADQSGLALTKYREKADDPGIDDARIERRGRFDMRLRKPEKTGPWFTTDETDIIGVGVMMHEIARDGWKQRSAAVRHPAIPPLYAVFKNQINPDPNYAPLQRYALARSRTLYDNPLPGSICSHDCTVKSVRRQVNTGHVVVSFVEDSVPDMVLPYATVLRPGVMIGTSLQAGAVLADPIPKAKYQIWDQLVAAVGQQSANKFLAMVFESECVEALGGFAYPAQLVANLSHAIAGQACDLVRRFEGSGAYFWPQLVRSDMQFCGLIFTAADGTPVNMLPLQV